MKIKKGSISLLLVLLMVGINPITAFADVIKTAVFSNDIGITINDTKYDARVVIIDGTSYLPIRILGYAINAETKWDEKNRTVILTKKEGAVKVKKVSQTLDGKLDKKKAYFSDDIKLVVDGERMNKQVVIVEGISYLPIKAVGENMGIRATWDEETRVIKIVNPKIAVVDKSIKEYYVVDLPKVQTQEDYLVGNWYGSSGWNGGTRWNKEVFISKNNDGSYKVISKGVESNGKYYIVEQKGSYNSNTKILTTQFIRYIYNGGYGNYNNDSFKLEGDTLYQISGVDWGRLERF